MGSHITEKAFEIKKIAKNRDGKIVSVDISLPGQLKPGNSAVRLSEIIEKLDRTPLASEVLINVKSDFFLEGKGEFFGFEVDFNTQIAESSFTINLVQNIITLNAGQTFVSLLTNSPDTDRIKVNLSGELKSKLMGKIEKQRCKN